MDPHISDSNKHLKDTIGLYVVAIISLLALASEQRAASCNSIPMVNIMIFVVFASISWRRT